MSTPTEEGKEEEASAAADEMREAAEEITQLAPPPSQEPKQLRFTIICRSPGDVAAVHIMGINVEAAKFSARQLLGTNVPDTTADDWEALIAYLGFQEIL